jgi:hypothetical protein
MTKELMLNRGYHITVTSWENDADNYNTKTLVAQDREEVGILVALFELLGSRNRNDDAFGNMYEPSEAERQNFANAVAAIPGMIAYLEKNFAWLKEAMEDPECGAGHMDAVMDILYDVGLSGSEYYYTRVCEKITVFYVEHDVYAERIV